MVFFKQNRRLADSGIFNNLSDYHSHILYGLDDGIRDQKKSQETLTFMQDLGIKKVFLTPHVMEDVPNTTDALEIRFHQLLTSYNGKIHLHLGAEYMLDGLFKQRLQTNDVLTLKNKYILVETSYFRCPIDLNMIFHNIQQKGYQFLFAHPEKCHYIDDVEYYRELKQMGAKFQLSIGSIVGLYGKKVREKAHKLVRMNMYDVLGTDTHSLKSLKHMVHSPCKLNIIRILEDLKDREL